MGYIRQIRYTGYIYIYIYVYGIDKLRNPSPHTAIPPLPIPQPEEENILNTIPPTINEEESTSKADGDVDIEDLGLNEVDLSTEALNQSELKLVTCFPFDAIVSGGSLRYVVTASFVSLLT